MTQVNVEALKNKPAKGTTDRHYPAVDGMRGFAAIVATGLHFILEDPTFSPLNRSLRYATGLGWTSVDMFFCISGFLITQILLNTRSGSGYFKKFYIRRALRIIPLYYVFITFLFVILPIFGLHPAGEKQWTWPYFFTHTSNFLNWNNIGFGPKYSGHFWSLAFEEQFYLVWPILIYLCPSKVLAKLFPALLCATVFLRWFLTDVTGGNGLSIISLPFARADGLLLGSWIAFMVWKGWNVKLPSLTVQIVILSFCAAFIGAFTFELFGVSYYTRFWGGADLAIWMLTLTSMDAMLLIYCIAPPNPIQKFFSNRVFRWFGKYSYGLYVLHYTIMWVLLANADFLQLMKSIASYSPSLESLVYMTILYGLSIVAALISWNVVERPALKLKRFFSYDKPKSIKAEPTSVPIGQAQPIAVPALQEATT